MNTEETIDTLSAIISDHLQLCSNHVTAESLQELGQCIAWGGSQLFAEFSAPLVKREESRPGQVNVAGLAERANRILNLIDDPILADDAFTRASYAAHIAALGSRIRYIADLIAKGETTLEVEDEGIKKQD